LLSAEQYVKFAKGISKNQAIMGVTRSPGIVGLNALLYLGWAEKIKMYYTEVGIDVKHASWAGVQD